MLGGRCWTRREMLDEVTRESRTRNPLESKEIMAFPCTDFDIYATGGEGVG